MNKNRHTHVELGQLFRLCHIIRWLLLTFLAVQIGFFILSWVMAGPLTVGPIHMQINPDGMSGDAVERLSYLQRFLGLLVGVPGLAALTYGIRHLGATLNDFQAGKIFASDTIRHLRTAAGATIAAVVLFNLETPLRNLAFSLADSGQNDPIALDVTSNELLLLLVCSMFYLIVGVMHEGRRLSEENEGFV